MTNDERTTFILEHHMGFPPDASGPYVMALRALVAKQVAQGMVNRSGGSWADPAIWHDHEERARCLLELDWEIEHGHTHRVELVDTGPIMRRYDFNTGRRYWLFRPRLIVPWLRDRWRERASDIRVWWNRRVRRLRNPYTLTGDTNGSHFR